MKKITKQSDKKTAFTIIELLTVMSIIIVLIGLLVPSLNMVKRFAKEVRQKAQFHSIESAMELFAGEWDGYPPSSAMDGAAPPEAYCGAMKLCEAMVGQDLMGFHPSSRFRADLTIDGLPATQLYASGGLNPPPDNLKSRKTYIQQSTDAYKLGQLYATTGALDPDLYVLCDVYNRVKHRETGKGIGMPILYYKANPLNLYHDPNNLAGAAVPTAWDQDNGYIYNYWDNQELVALGLPPGGAGAPVHPLVNPNRFYDVTKDKRITIDVGRPQKLDSYILISAGYDGTYGTDDDIFNFEN